MRIIEICLAVLLVISAIYAFDLHSLNQWIISLLLLLIAGTVVVRDRKLHKLMTRTALFLVIFLLFKLLITG